MKRICRRKHARDAGPPEPEQQRQLCRARTRHEVARGEEASELAAIDPPALAHHFALHQRHVRGRPADRPPPEWPEHAEHRAEIVHLRGFGHGDIVRAHVRGASVSGAVPATSTVDATS